jgi:succinyl-CoA synthetase beta subunit
MNVHEYQAKQLLSKFHVPVLPGSVALNPKEAIEAARDIPSNLWVVKAQIHAGGRGKGGGIKLAKSVDEVGEITQKMIGMNLVTPQTSKEGKKVRFVYIESGCDIETELYYSILIDRETKRTTIVASSEGGVDIEEVAEKTPEKIFKVAIDPITGVCGHHIRYLNKALGIPKETSKLMGQFIQNTYRAFVESDASLLEVNPLVITKQKDLYALDAKMSFDSNALYRHPAIKTYRDMDEEDPKELEASQHDLNYIALDGNIGCMVNGAGLAMATMDIIKLHGGDPANFLDVGGGASKEKVTEAFKIILADQNVKGILVNIFGGIMKCDVIAEGIIAAAKETKLSVPLVVRLQGTNVDKGKQLLDKSGLKITAANSLDEAAKQIVSAVKGGK